MFRHPASYRIPTIAAAATLVLLVTACTPIPPSSDTPSPPANAVPAGLERFYGQEMSWEQCESYAITAIEAAVYASDPSHECAHLEVPADYGEPEGVTAQIAVLRVPATGTAIGSLVMNPGGPGGSGLFGAASTGGQLAESRLREKFDLVGFDPRGVGASIPAIDCYSDEEADRLAVPLSTQGSTVQWTEDETRQIVDRCAEGSGGTEILAQVGTRDVARDMDVLRAALGDEKLSYLGQSYGTRLGAVYAEQFPQNVRALLLDGAIDSRQGTAERRVAAFTGFQSAFDEMAARCVTEADCPLGTDASSATEKFNEIVRPLLDTPVPALEAELSFDGAIEGVIAALYYEDAWPRVSTGLTQLQQGRGDELLQLSYDFSLRGPEGVWPNAPESLFAINCMDEERLTEDQGNELRAAIFEAAPFMDPGVELSGARDACEHWPADPTLGFPYATDVDGLPDSLVVSITGDPTTPHAGAVRLAETLGSALLTVEGQGHTIVSTGMNSCINEIASAYLIDLELPAEGAVCTLTE